MRGKSLAAAIGVARASFGLALIAAPSRIARGWIGEDADRQNVKVLVRAVGVRDVVVGLGTVMALRRNVPARGWLEGGIAADAGDIIGTLYAAKHLPRHGALMTIGLAAFAIAVTARAVRTLDGGATPAQEGPAAARG